MSRRITDKEKLQIKRQYGAIDMLLGLWEKRIREDWCNYLEIEKAWIQIDRMLKRRGLLEKPKKERE